MTMDKLFDGSDAHLLGANAALIQRLRTYAAHHNSALLTESADTLEAADKRIAEMEWIIESCNADLVHQGESLEKAYKRTAELESGWAACHAQLAESCDERYKLERKLAELETFSANRDDVISYEKARASEAERKLAVAREVMEDLCDWDGDLVLKDFCEGVLAQIGGDDAGS